MSKKLRSFIVLGLLTSTLMTVEAAHFNFHEIEQSVGKNFKPFTNMPNPMIQDPTKYIEIFEDIDGKKLSDKAILSAVEQLFRKGERPTIVVNAIRDFVAHFYAGHVKGFEISDKAKNADANKKEQIASALIQVGESVDSKEQLEALLKMFSDDAFKARPEKVKNHIKNCRELLMASGQRKLPVKLLTTDGTVSTKNLSAPIASNAFLSAIQNVQKLQLQIESVVEVLDKKKAAAADLKPFDYRKIGLAKEILNIRAEAEGDDNKKDDHILAFSKAIGGLPEIDFDDKKSAKGLEGMFSDLIKDLGLLKGNLKGEAFAPIVQAVHVIKRKNGWGAISAQEGFLKNALEFFNGDKNMFIKPDEEKTAKFLELLKVIGEKNVFFDYVYAHRNNQGPNKNFDSISKLPTDKKIELFNISKNKAPDEYSAGNWGKQLMYAWEGKSGGYQEYFVVSSSGDFNQNGFDKFMEKAKEIMAKVGD